MSSARKIGNGAKRQIGGQTTKHTAERKDTKSIISDEKQIASNVEQWFDGDILARLDSTIPNVIKRDLKELTGCIDTEGTKSVRSANRVIVEALVDVFKKYKEGNGGFKLLDEPAFKGKY